MTLKCIGGPDFRPRIFFKLDCHHMFKSLFCNLHEMSYKIWKDKPISRGGHFWPSMNIVLSSFRYVNVCIISRENVFSVIPVVWVSPLKHFSENVSVSFMQNFVILSVRFLLDSPKVLAYMYFNDFKLFGQTGLGKQCRVDADHTSVYTVCHSV